ncbi:hypothetical protein RHI9324_04938 [Rhizobium sp. CECT 9324]|nr:hypothetical protein RHI9324_04938 [Rhizobium sp. CECT 9324]
MVDMSRYSNTVATDHFNKRTRYRGLKEGGDPAYTLSNLINGVQKVTNERCAPTSQIIPTEVSAESQQKDHEMFALLEQKYNNYTEVLKNTGKDSCEKCLLFANDIRNTAKSRFSLIATDEDIISGLYSESFSRFLDHVLVPKKCWSNNEMLRLRRPYYFKVFPNENEKADYLSSIAMIKDVLKGGYPLGLAFCAQVPLVARKSEDCDKYHAVAVVGYRQVCKGKKCRDAIRVQNWWGDWWYSANDDGWVDAKAVLDASFYDAHMLTWIDGNPPRE